ncbi:MAG: ABC transporter permease [Phycisphaerae bacterium]|jgi:ABC-type antimicrobial peptide transport system permease subunit
MAYLPLANILHYKLRSALSAFGIGIGICMLVTLSGLSRGTLGEIADRWEAVDADLIVFPRGWGENASDKSGSALPDRWADKIRSAHGDIVERITPIFTWQIRLGGQDQLAVGVDSDQWQHLTGGRQLREGRLFDPDKHFAQWIRTRLLTASPDSDANEVAEGLSQQDLSDPQHAGLELVIDSRLAAAGHYTLGQTVTTANHEWKIVGIVPAGAMARVFMPRQTAQYLFGNGDITKSTLMFVKLRGGADVGPAARDIGKTTGQDVVPLGRYRGMLMEKFGIMFVYVDAVNVIALVIAFLFIMITLYTMVLQRTREIAILKSAGASNFFLLRQVLAESLLLTGAGTAAGAAMSVGAAWLIQTLRPLLTVTLTPRMLVTAVVVAAAGAIVAALYPAWRAVRVDIAEALTLE